MVGLPGSRGDRGSPGPVGGLVSDVYFCIYLFTCTVRISNVAVGIVETAAFSRMCLTQ